jgi:hypothetical protein
VPVIFEKPADKNGKGFILYKEIPDNRKLMLLSVPLANDEAILSGAEIKGYIKWIIRETIGITPAIKGSLLLDIIAYGIIEPVIVRIGVTVLFCRQQWIEPGFVLFPAFVQHFKVIYHFRKRPPEVPEIHLTQDMDIFKGRSFKVEITVRIFLCQGFILKNPLPFGSEGHAAQEEGAMVERKMAEPVHVATVGRQDICIDGRFLKLGTFIKDHPVVRTRPGHLRAVEGIELHDKPVDKMNAVGIIQGRLVRFVPEEFLRCLVPNEIGMIPLESATLQVVNDRGQRFGSYMEIGKAVQRYLTPGHRHAILNDLLGNDSGLTDSPAADKNLVRLGREQNF